MATGRGASRGDGPRGTLYVVATPIGNLEDLSPRAVRVLAEVDIVAAEDTRVTGRLLRHAGVKANRLVSYRDENERRMTTRLIGSLTEGLSVALVSDAGTPAVSDPGFRLVAAAGENDIEVVTVPGPSAVIALLAVSGLPVDRFCFEGFLPKTTQPRRRSIEAMAGSGRTYVLYESPMRVVRLLRELTELLDDPEVVVGRELTKRYEEVLRGRASRVADDLEQRGPRGEFVVAVHAPAGDADSLSADELALEVKRLLDAGLSVRDAAARLKPRGVARRAVYDAARKLDPKA